MNRITVLIAILICSLAAISQQIDLSDKLNAVSFSDDEGVLQFAKPIPLFSFIIDEKMYFSDQYPATRSGDSLVIDFEGRFNIVYHEIKDFNRGWKASFRLTNTTNDTIIIENVVPFGQTDDHIYLTGTGPWALARTNLFLPGKGPVGVILPDNTWEMGYGACDLKEGGSVCAIARRTTVKNARKHRYITWIYPGGSINYDVYADKYEGEWQNGIKLMFQERYLYDLESFDNSMFEREDLKWIRHEYVMALQTGWDKQFYDWKSQEYTFDKFLDEGMKYFGGWDIYGLWPTFPRLGLDQRNQWDMFGHLPGGIEKLKELSLYAKDRGTRFFICYNPWDESTRQGDHLVGMADLIRDIDADGVVLDTRGASSKELQQAADGVKPGVIMYSEGMAITKDMPGIVSGRVHDAIYLPPPLNLNKVIKPDFAIFRVCQLNDGRIRREAAIALFNGYGIEINMFAPGRPDWIEEDLIYLGRTTMTLRENTSNFLVKNWTPLINTRKDSIWVNYWPGGEKTVYTVFSLVPEGFKGPLFTVENPTATHFVSLWHHEELALDTVEGKMMVLAYLESFNRSDLDTRVEGNVDMIAQFPELLKVIFSPEKMIVETSRGDQIKIWAGMPSYQNENFITILAGNIEIDLQEYFGSYRGKYVVQLFEREELIDERVMFLKPGAPRLISKVESAKGKPSKDMIFIKGGEYMFYATNSDQFVPYPNEADSVIVEVNDYYIDKYPVTNKDYYEFLQASGYQPTDTTHFLMHWKDGKYPEELADHPVVYIDYDDAKAFAKWAGKRLPTEIEWQYAIQGKTGNLWPWGNEFDSLKCNNSLGHTSSVYSFPQGATKSGIMDMVGNVWQMTNDLYEDGPYYFIIIKGGSYYNPTSSWWYIKGGPQPATWHQMQLLVSPGYDRCSTVGFRCVVDSEQ